MASIYGVSLKGVKTFVGHEGVSAQGNVYYNGKKIGFWSQDTWGGPDRYDFDKKLIEGAVEAYKKSGRVEKEFEKYFDADCLIYEVLRLMDSEKTYKAGVKKGFKTLVEASSMHMATGYYTNEANPEGTAYYKKFLADCEKKFYKGESIKVHIYRSLDDFNIND